MGRVLPVASGPYWREEATGLHALEFIETHRHWFTGPVMHAANGSVNVLNRVAGEHAIVESPDRRFEPFAVNYAETFIVPAAAGDDVVRPEGPQRAGDDQGVR